MKISWKLIVLTMALMVPACGGGSSYSGNTTSPSPTPSPTPTPTPIPTGGGSGAVTIDIVASSGNQAFNPNPVQAAAGTMLVWKNDTTELHHIVMDDGSADFGNIAPGAASTAMAVPGSGGTYHCTIHPSMVGSINGDSAPQPPSDGGSTPGY
jgi:plastocyanin